MDGIAVFFILLMSAVGGLCAYVADILGYKIGKKRISIKRVRPKYVARTAVVVAGVLIPLITVGIIFAASSDFRQWITQGQKAIKEAQEKSRQLEKVQQDVNEKQVQLRTTENQLKENEAKRVQIEKVIEQQKSKQKELQSKLDTLGPKIATLQGQVSSLTRQDNELKVEKTKNLAALADVRQNLTKAKADLESSKKQYHDAVKDYNETTKRNLELTSEKAHLESDNGKLLGQIEELRKQVPDLAAQVASLKQAKATAETEANTAKEANEKLRQDTAILRANAKSQLEQYSAIAKLQNVTFKKGEEIGRITVVPKMSLADRQSAFRGLLRRAKSVASSRGAEPDPSTLPFAGSAGFVIERDGVALSEDEVEDYWVAQMGQAKQEEVVILRAATNTFGNEPLLLNKLEILPNPIVFRKGEIVAETRFDPRTTDSEIRANVREFLRTFVNTRARMRKMIPVHAASGDSYGELSEDQYFDAFLRAKTITRIVRLVAIAHDDIRAGDPLNVDLEFR